MKWFRMYSEVLHDPKVQRLTPAMFKHWVNLLCLANDSTPRGVLPSTEDIAFALRIKPTEAARIVADLVKLQLLELTPDGRAIPHNWTERQRNSDDVAARVARHRGKETPQSPPPQGTNHKPTNGYVTLHETLPVTLHNPQSNVLDRDKDKEQNRLDSIESAPTPAPKGSTLVPGKNAPKATKQITLPQSYPLTDEMRVWARMDVPDLGDRIDSEHKKFCNHYRSKGERRADWRPAWETWMIRAVEEFAPKGQKGSVTHDRAYDDPDAINAEIQAVAAAERAASRDVPGNRAEPVSFRRRA